MADLTWQPVATIRTDDEYAMAMLRYGGGAEIICCDLVDATPEWLAAQGVTHWRYLTGEELINFWQQFKRP